ncbi:MAG: EutN/CcmL family microcompartment protein [Alkalispirochaeta sp.]
MILGRVVGTVVAANKDVRLEGVASLIVEMIDPRSCKGTGAHLVALDAVGAGVGEVVMCVSGSSSRMTAVTDGRPVDATITAIVDMVDFDRNVVYRKDGS